MLQSYFNKCLISANHQGREEPECAGPSWISYKWITLNHRTNTKQIPSINGKFPVGWQLLRNLSNTDVSYDCETQWTHCRADWGEASQARPPILHRMSTHTNTNTQILKYKYANTVGCGGGSLRSWASLYSCTGWARAVSTESSYSLDQDKDHICSAHSVANINH